jgi:threonine/homoserine/homoserine lactone efflux protein
LNHTGQCQQLFYNVDTVGLFLNGKNVDISIFVVGVDQTVVTVQRSYDTWLIFRRAVGMILAWISYYSYIISTPSIMQQWFLK